MWSDKDLTHTYVVDSDINMIIISLKNLLSCLTSIFICAILVRVHELARILPPSVWIFFRNSCFKILHEWHHKLFPTKQRAEFFLAWWSNRSFPSISECLGIHPSCVTFFFNPSFTQIEIAQISSWRTEDNLPKLALKLVLEDLYLCVKRFWSSNFCA